MFNPDARQEVLRVLSEKQRFIIASHEDPDGDSLGSSIALALGLEQIGKEVSVVIAQMVPCAYRWLPEISKVESVVRLPESEDVAVLVECSDFERSGITGFEGRLTVNIDHHTKNAQYATVNWIQPEVAATGVMILELLERMNVEITPEIATHLYVAILTDTGSFRYSHTDADTFRVVAKLVDRGADPERCAEAVYSEVAAEKVRLTARALATLTFEEDGRIAWMQINKDVFEELNGFTDTEGIINHAQAIRGVDVAILFKEMAEESIRVSLRSRGSIDVSNVSHEHGGGGHPRAAGCTIAASVAKAREQILYSVRSRLARAEGGG